MDPLNAGITDDLLFGSSERMQQLRRQIESMADTGLPVLIEGESGTGKEVLARAIHARTSRRGRAFVKINCSVATPFVPLDRLIFGDERAAPAYDNAPAYQNMTGQGATGCAKAGTVFFDDIGELDLSLQPEVTALLQNGGRLEHHDAARRNRNFLAGLRIAADPLAFFAHDKRSERRQFHGFAALKAIGDFLEHQFDQRSRFRARQAHLLVDRLTQIRACYCSSAHRKPRRRRISR